MPTGGDGNNADGRPRRQPVTTSTPGGGALRAELLECCFDHPVALAGVRYDTDIHELVGWAGGEPGPPEPIVTPGRSALVATKR
jgi:hypothetical protein